MFQSQRRASGVKLDHRAAPTQIVAALPAATALAAKRQAPAGNGVEGMKVRFYIDRESGEPHIGRHGVSEQEVSTSPAPYQNRCS